MSGLLAMVGGSEWREGCVTFDKELLAASGGTEVLVLPTAAAYEHPERAVQWATDYFKGLGATVRGLMVLRRPDAMDEANAEAIRQAKFIYIGGGSSLHLRSVLKDSAVWEAILHAWDQGAVLAGSSAGAMVLCDPMVDPRGGAFTLGLGLVNQVTIIPHANTWSHDKARRTFELASANLSVVLVDEQTALIRESHGHWRAEGAGAVAAYRAGQAIELNELPA